MGKILKYVPVFFFWLAGLTLSAHMFIPHDHHLAEPNSTQDKNCSVPINKSEHKSGFPLHCHAFNDIATEKVRLIHITPNNQFSFCDLGILNDFISLKIQISSICFYDFQKPILNSYTLGLSLLRAPPSLA